jgi:hypothetical protein
MQLKTDDQAQDGSKEAGWMHDQMVLQVNHHHDAKIDQQYQAEPETYHKISLVPQPDGDEDRSCFNDPGSDSPRLLAVRASAWPENVVYY